MSAPIEDTLRCPSRGSSTTSSSPPPSPLLIISSSSDSPSSSDRESPISASPIPLPDSPRVQLAAENVLPPVAPKPVAPKPVAPEPVALREPPKWWIKYSVETGLFTLKAVRILLPFMISLAIALTLAHFGVSLPLSPVDFTIAGGTFICLIFMLRKWCLGRHQRKIQDGLAKKTIEALNAHFTSIEPKIITALKKAHPQWAIHLKTMQNIATNLNPKNAFSSFQEFYQAFDEIAGSPEYARLSKADVSCDLVIFMENLSVTLNEKVNGTEVYEEFGKKCLGLDDKVDLDREIDYSVAADLLATAIEHPHTDFNRNSLGGKLSWVLYNFDEFCASARSQYQGIHFKNSIQNGNLLSRLWDNGNVHVLSAPGTFDPALEVYRFARLHERTTLPMSFNGYQNWCRDLEGHRVALAKEWEKASSSTVSNTLMDGHLWEMKTEGALENVSTPELFFTYFQEQLDLERKKEPHSYYMDPDVQDWAIGKARGLFPQKKWEQKLSELGPKKMGQMVQFTLQVLMGLGNQKPDEESLSLSACKQQIDRGAVMTAAQRFLHLNRSGKNMTYRQLCQITGFCIGRAVLVENRSPQESRTKPFCAMLRSLFPKEADKHAILPDPLD